MKRQRGRKRSEKKRGTKRARHQAALAARPINAELKGLTVASEPPIDADPAKLSTVFFQKLQAAFTVLSGQGTPFKLVEGFRTTDRQQWLFGSGRPTAEPFGRPGPILTNADGVKARSSHQGDGTPGTGRAADCYPLKDGKVHIPPSSDPIWTAYAKAVTDQGLVAGHNFPRLKDSPHCELR